MGDEGRDWLNRCEQLKHARVDFDGHFGMDGEPGQQLDHDGRPLRESLVERILAVSEVPRSFRRGVPRRPDVYLGAEFGRCSECGVELHATFDGELIRLSSGRGPCTCPDGAPDRSSEPA